MEGLCGELKRCRDRKVIGLCSVVRSNGRGGIRRAGGRRLRFPILVVLEVLMATATVPVPELFPLWLWLCFSDFGLFCMCSLDIGNCQIQSYKYTTIKDKH